MLSPKEKNIENKSIIVHKGSTNNGFITQSTLSEITQT